MSKEDFIKALHEHDLTYKQFLDLKYECDRLSWQDKYDLLKEDSKRGKHGEWLIDISGLLMCSKCGTFLDEFQKPSRFCPNCGANMQEIKE